MREIVKSGYKRVGTDGSENIGRRGEFNWHLNPDFRCVVLPSMAEEKSRSKDIVLWIITVVLIALAIYWYKR
jgi:hypothetical protein